MKRYIFLLLFFLSFVHSYELLNGKTTLFSGYRTDSFIIHHQSRANDPNSIDEKLKNFHLYEIGVKSDYLFNNIWYLGGNISYRIGGSSDLKTTWRIEALNSTKTFSTTTVGNFPHKGREDALDTRLVVGYQFRFGPIFVRPLIGGFYNFNLLDRKNVSSLQVNTSDQGNAVTYLFYPKNHLNIQWATGLVGLHLTMYPIIFGRLSYEASYEFLLGKVFQTAKYYGRTTVLQNTRDLEYKLSSNGLALGHYFSLSAIYGIKEWISLGGVFSYRYYISKNGTSKYTLTGTQTTNNVSSGVRETFDKDLKKLSQQSYSFELLINFQY